MRRRRPPPAELKAAGRCCSPHSVALARRSPERVGGLCAAVRHIIYVHI